MIGLEYRNQNMLRAFPLDANQDIPEYIQRCLVDAYFQLPYNSSVVPALKSFSVDETGDAYGRDNSFAVRLRIEDKISGRLLISVETSIWRRYSGRDGGSYYSDDNFSCVVLSGAGLYEYTRDLQDRLNESWVGELLFDTHCVEYDNPNVTSMTFKNEDGTVVYSTDWQSEPRMGFIANGDGVTVTVEEEGQLIGDKKGLVYALVDGKVTLDVDDANRNIEVNNSANNTLAIISGSSCLDVITNPMNRSIVIVNKCVACCSCNQYKEKVEEVTALANKISGLKTTFHDSVDTYNDLVRKLNSSSFSDDLFSITVTASGYNPSTQHVFADPVMTCNATIVNNNCHDVFWKCLGFRATGSWVEKSRSTMWFLRTKDPTLTRSGKGWPNLMIPSGCSLSVTSRLTTSDRSVVPPPGHWTGTVVCMGTFDPVGTVELPSASGYLHID